MSNYSLKSNILLWFTEIEKNNIVSIMNTKWLQQLFISTFAEDNHSKLI